MAIMLPWYDFIANSNDSSIIDYYNVANCECPS